MNRIDYELGLMSSEEDFQNADGKALFLACTAGCIPKHPFNKGKREDCKAKCPAKFEVRQTDKKIFGANKALRDRAAVAAETAVATAEAEKVSDNSDENVKDKGLSTGAMIGIGVGVLALVGIVVLIIKKR